MVTAAAPAEHALVTNQQAMVPRLSTDHLAVHFEHRSALEDINLDFYPSQIVSLIGQNGAGKSTLLKCLAGIMTPTHGVVLLNGEPLTRPSPSIAYVPQRSDVDWTFPISVLDVTLMGRGLHSSRLFPLGSKQRREALAALDRVGMAALAGVQIGALSGGQQQRVFLARAILQQAVIYLLDEPFSGIDIPTQTLVLDVLGGLRQNGCTIVYATHDLAMAEESADECVILNRRLVAAGPPRQVITAENLKIAFGGAALLPASAAAQ
jgi:manganese/zinc/iron transport system ATP- binding protein